MASLTAAQYRAMQAPSVLTTPRKPPASPKEPRPRNESLKTNETPEDATPPPTVAETHYIGRYQLNVANGTHYPGRMRAVLVGPTDPKLLDYLTAALHQYTKQP